ncbi:putative tail fiber protein [Vibrio phage phiKT1028]|nr:putative tail fiber protein [Vibrio phage phiKT1028]
MSYLNYPWNPFGDNQECLVPNENITALGEERDLLVPRYGPFFEKNFKLKDAQTGVELKAGRDFVFVYPFNEFIKQYNRTVFGGITLLSSGKNRQLIIERYVTLGEPFTMNDQEFINLTANIIHSDRIANWSQVVNLPMEGFPSDPHAHEPDLTYNYQALIDVLTQLDQAQRNEFNNPTVATELIEHINKSFKLAHPSATAEDFNLGKVANYAPATDADLNGNSDQVYLTLAKGRALTEKILTDLGMMPDQQPLPPGSEVIDDTLTTKDALAMFLSKKGLLSEIYEGGKVAQRAARLNLGLNTGALAQVVQALGQSVVDVVSQKLLTDELAKKVPTTRKINGKPLTSDITIDVETIDTYTKEEIDVKLNTKLNKSLVVQTTGTSTTQVMSQKIVTDEIAKRVHNSRTINGKALTSNISLSAADVGTYTKSEIDSKDTSVRNAAVLKSALTESTGTNTEIAMSQRGVTNAINTRVPTGRKVNGKTLTTDISITAADVGAYTKSEADSRYNNYIPKSRMTNSTGSSTEYVMTQRGVTDQLNTKVPTSRTINGKALTGNISLSAGNVGAYTKTEVDNGLANRVPKTWIQQGTGSNTSYVMSQKAVTDQLNTKVPTGRTINGKSLTANISLGAGDVGTYTKAQIDSKIGTKLDKAKLVQGLGPYADNIMSQKAITDAIYARVPTSRKVNGKALTGDITITKADVGLPHVEDRRWALVKSGSLDLGLANGNYVYRGSVYTGIKTSGRRFDPMRYRVILKTDGTVSSSAPTTMWWNAYPRLDARQYWSDGNQLWITVYSSGYKVAGGKITGYDLYEWR